MNEFPHERLDVYQAAVKFLALAEDLASDLPKGRAYLADQLRRAALSISLNIAEGAGEFMPLEKARFYRMARRSGTECVAILDACRILRLAVEDRIRAGREVLYRVQCMLTAMVLRLQDEERGKGGIGRGRGREHGQGSEENQESGTRTNGNECD